MLMILATVKHDMGLTTLKIKMNQFLSLVPQTRESRYILEVFAKIRFSSWQQNKIYSMCSDFKGHELTTRKKMAEKTGAMEQVKQHWP